MKTLVAAVFVILFANGAEHRQDIKIEKAACGQPKYHGEYDGLPATFHIECKK